jgi:hypothetical protein
MPTPNSSTADSYNSSSSTAALLSSSGMFSSTGGTNSSTGTNASTNNNDNPLNDILNFLFQNRLSTGVTAAVAVVLVLAICYCCYRRSSCAQPKADDGYREMPTYNNRV